MSSYSDKRKKKMYRENEIKELAENVLKKAAAAETPNKVAQVSKAARDLIGRADAENKYPAKYPAALMQLRQVYTDCERYKRRQEERQRTSCGNPAETLRK